MFAKITIFYNNYYSAVPKKTTTIILTLWWLHYEDSFMYVLKVFIPLRVLFLVRAHQ